MVKLKITICNAIRSKYPGNDIEIEGYGTPEATGWLEVFIEDTQELVHSKKNGDGYVDSQEKIEKILNAVGKAIQQ
ncbi:selenoprotein W1 [Chloropicon primus]|nr:selenoprotein W1 [Chloropicon primus]